MTFDFSQVNIDIRMNTQNGPLLKSMPELEDLVGSMEGLWISPFLDSIVARFFRQLQGVIVLVLNSGCIVRMYMSRR